MAFAPAVLSGEPLDLETSSDFEWCPNSGNTGPWNPSYQTYKVHWTWTKPTGEWTSEEDGIRWVTPPGYIIVDWHDGANWIGESITGNYTAGSDHTVSCGTLEIGPGGGFTINQGTTYAVVYKDSIPPPDFTFSAPHGLILTDLPIVGCARTVRFNWTNGTSQCYKWDFDSQSWYAVPFAVNAVLKISTDPLFPNTDATTVYTPQAAPFDQLPGSQSVHWQSWFWNGTAWEYWSNIIPVFSYMQFPLDDVTRYARLQWYNPITGAEEHEDLAITPLDPATVAHRYHFGLGFSLGADVQAGDTIFLAINNKKTGGAITATTLSHPDVAFNPSPVAQVSFAGGEQRLAIYQGTVGPSFDPDAYNASGALTFNDEKQDFVQMTTAVFRGITGVDSYETTTGSSTHAVGPNSFTISIALAFIGGQGYAYNGNWRSVHQTSSFAGMPRSQWRVAGDDSLSATPEWDVTFEPINWAIIRLSLLGTLSPGGVLGDDFEDAIEITPGYVFDLLAQDYEKLTMQDWEGDVSFFIENNSIWFKFVGDGADRTITATSPDFSPAIAVFTWDNTTPENLNELSVTYSPFVFSNELGTPTEDGVTYYVQIGSRFNDEVGPLHVEFF